jgi:uncharacterized protein (TIGR02246 family)
VQVPLDINKRSFRAALLVSSTGAEALWFPIREVSMTQPGDENAIRALYEQLLDAWNRRDAHAFATLVAEDGNVVGFDGSQINGRTEVDTQIGQIFADHQTAAYIGKIREIRFLTPDVAILRAVVGMVPPGQTDLNPAVNTVQSLVATKRESQWRIALFQNTPAQLHGRPDLVQQLTDELRQLLPHHKEA